MNLPMEEAYDLLVRRKLRDLKMSHWLQTGPEQIVCLDFNLVAGSKEELLPLVRQAIDAAATHPQDILPASGRSLWVQYQHPKSVVKEEPFAIKHPALARGLMQVIIRGR